MRIASVILICTLATCCFVSSTFAKYTTTAEVTSDKAVVAKWSIKVNDKDIVQKDKVVFDLFKTINTTGGGKEEHVRPTDANGNKIIAPGTEGSFSFRIHNESDVAATYGITFTTNQEGLPIEFSCDNGATWYKANDLESNVKFNDTLDVDSGEVTKTVKWRWLYEAEDPTDITNADTTDTSLGAESTLKTINITAKITATQVD